MVNDGFRLTINWDTPPLGHLPIWRTRHQLHKEGCPGTVANSTWKYKGPNGTANLSIVSGATPIRCLYSGVPRCLKWERLDEHFEATSCNGMYCQMVVLTFCMAFHG